MTQKQTTAVSSALFAAEEAVGGLWHDVMTEPPSRDYHTGYNQAVQEAVNKIKKLLVKYTEDYNKGSQSPWRRMTPQEYARHFSSFPAHRAEVTMAVKGDPTSAEVSVFLVPSNAEDQVLSEVL